MLSKSKSKQLTSTSGIPLVLLSRFPGFASNAMALMTPQRVKQAVAVADEHLLANPKAKTVFLEIVGPCDGFRVCQVTHQAEMLILAPECAASVTITEVRLGNGCRALYTDIDAIVI